MKHGNEPGLHEEKFKILQRLILTATVEHIKKLILLHLPPGVLQDFLIWIFTTSNTAKEKYLQITGITKVSELSAALLFDLDIKDLQEVIMDDIPPAIKKLSDYLGALNAFFFCEIVSDNLAIGLAAQKKEDATWKIRRDILRHFNEVMQKKLAGDATATRDLLQQKADIIEAISSFDYSLVAKEIRELAVDYQIQYPDISFKTLEFSTLDYLVLNIEACLNVVHLMPDVEVTAFLTQALSERYSAGNSLFDINAATSLDTLLEYGKKTILVAPVMLYVVTVINSILPHSGFHSLIQNKKLLQAVEIAALLIRINNDVGTQFLIISEEEYKHFQQVSIQNYKKQADENPLLTSFEFLEILAKDAEFSSLLTRIQKDIQYGEFNICLDNLRHISDPIEGLNILFENLAYFRKIYQEKRNALIQLLKDIEIYLQTNRIVLPILKMVIFHEKLYENTYKKSQGEFAMKN